MSKWKYFSDNEIVGLTEDLVFKLERARELYGYPIVITSGYRPPAHNAAVGGVSNSAHETGLAVDIRAPIKSLENAELREKLAWALGAAGFRRVGTYDRHFHADVDKEKPIPAWWAGKSK